MQQFLAWLWQGTMLALGVWAVLRLVRPNSATRFAIWWATLLAVQTLLILPRVSASVPPASGGSAAVSLPLLPWALPALPATVLAIGIGVWLGLALLGLVHV